MRKEWEKQNVALVLKTDCPQCCQMYTVTGESDGLKEQEVTELVARQTAILSCTFASMYLCFVHLTDG